MESDSEIYSDLETCDSDDEELNAFDPNDKKYIDEPAKIDLISAKKIYQHMTERINDVSQLIDMTPTVTRVLLNHFKWDDDKLMNGLYGSDQESLFAELNLAVPSSKPADATDDTIPVDCEICYSSHHALKTKALDCGHRFCLLCWKEYISTKILTSGLMSVNLTCPAFECLALVEDSFVMQLVKGEKAYFYYQRMITNSFVECNKLLSRCPNSQCGAVAKIDLPKFHGVQCVCGAEFCFQCGTDWHEPVRCQKLRDWHKKNKDDSETTNWLVINTKECPSCKSVIQKTDGCNHMTCRAPNCKAQFCWICLGMWSNGHSCNRYIEKMSHNERWDEKVITKRRLALERYMFYYRHYMHQKQSLVLETKEHARIDEKIGRKIFELKKNLAEFDFLKKGYAVLCKSRKLLMYSYVFAYFLGKNNQTEIFEDNQSDLSNATESLSKFLSTPITTENFQEISQELKNKHPYCNSRGQVLIGHVNEGFDRMWWTNVHGKSEE